MSGSARHWLPTPNEGREDERQPTANEAVVFRGNHKNGGIKKGTTKLAQLMHRSELQ